MKTRNSLCSLLFLILLLGCSSGDEDTASQSKPSNDAQPQPENQDTPSINEPAPIIPLVPIETETTPVTTIWNEAPPPILGLELYEGIFLDSKVSGLSYRSESSNGITDEEGKFEFYLDNELEFYLGDIALGSVNTNDLFFYDVSSGSPSSGGFGKRTEQFNTAIVTPLKITPEAEFEDDRRVINKLIFLQTLDEDGDPQNGIHIPLEISSHLVDWDIDFDQTLVDFSTGNFPKLIAYLNELNVFSAKSPRVPTSEVDALLHFQQIWPRSVIIGQFFGPDRYYINWRIDEECARPVKSIIEIDNDGIRLQPSKSSNQTLTGVQARSGRLIFPSFQTDTSCAEICTQASVKTNLILSSGDMTGSLEVQCLDETRPEMRLVIPSIKKHVYSIDTGLDSGLTISR